MSNASGPSTQEKLYDLSVEEGKKTLFFGADRKSRLTVDFESPEFLHRLKTSGRQQTLPKALGVSKGTRKVLDASGGLGGDAFVLASLGCEVMVFERNPVLCELLEDGLKRALASQLTCKTAEGDAMPIAKLAGRIFLNPMDVRSWNGPWEGLEAGFFDPMYSERNRKSLPRLEMQIMDHVVGEDLDQLEVALFLLKKLPRLVIKRPLNQTPLVENPRHQFEGSTTRYDVYFS